MKKKPSIKFDEQAWDRMSDVEKSDEHWSINLRIENSRISGKLRRSHGFPAFVRLLTPFRLIVKRSSPANSRALSDACTATTARLPSRSSGTYRFQYQIEYAILFEFLEYSLIRKKKHNLFQEKNLNSLYLAI